MMVASSLLPSAALAAVATEQPAPDLAGFDRGFQSGQDEFNRQRYLEAARVWTGAAGKLPETAEHRDNRRAIHEYIADAYEKALDKTLDDALLREGLAVLDAYLDAFAGAYPSEALPERVATTRTAFRARLAAREAKRQEDEKAREQPAAASAPAAPERAPARSWKGLAIGGGVAIAGGAAMLGMFAVGLAGAKAAEAKIEEPARGCVLDDLVGECADIDSQGKRSNAIGVTGIVAAPIFLAAGITMLVIAMRRKHSNKALAPMFGRGMAGLVWEQRF